MRALPARGSEGLRSAARHFPHAREIDTAAVTDDVARWRMKTQRIDDIVKSAGRTRGIPDALAKEYLTEHIVFELGEREYEGMNRFLQLASEVGSIDILGRITA